MWAVVAVWRKADLATKDRRLLYWLVQSKIHRSNLRFSPVRLFCGKILQNGLKEGQTKRIVFITTSILLCFTEMVAETVDCFICPRQSHSHTLGTSNSLIDLAIQWKSFAVYSMLFTASIYSRVSKKYELCKNTIANVKEKLRIRNIGHCWLESYVTGFIFCF